MALDITLPWLEAFKPKTMDQVCGNEFIVQYLREAMQQRRMQNCILYGPPGSGKTSTMQCLASAFEDKVMELTLVQMNASDERRVQDVEARLKPFFFEACHPFEIKLLLVDEVDNMTVGAQRLLAKYLEKDNSQFFNLSRIVVMACNEIQKVEPVLLAKLLALPFKPIDAGSMIQHLDGILAKLNVMINEKDEVDFWNVLSCKAEGDLRTAINTLQACCAKASPGQPLSLADLTSVCVLPAAKIVDSIVLGLQHGPLSSVLQMTRDLESQGYLLLDILQMIEKHVNNALSEDSVMIAQLNLIFAESYLIFARGGANMLQLDACLSAIHVQISSTTSM